MKPNHVFLAKTFLLLSISVLLFASLYACRREGARKDIEVTARTKYSGAINGSSIAVDVVATLNTGRGGRSSCTFTTMPAGLNPGSLGTAP